MGEVGAISTVSGDVLTSYTLTDGSTTTYKVDCSSTTTKATAVYEGLEFDGGTPHLKKYFSSIKVLTTPLPSGTSISAKFRMDGETAWSYAVLGDGSTTYSTADSTGAEFSIGRQGTIYECGVELNPTSNTSPEILAITTYLSDGTYEH